MHQSHLLQAILAATLEDPESPRQTPNPDVDRLSRTYTALLEAVNSGAEHEVIQFFCSLDLSALAPASRNAILRFLSRLAPDLQQSSYDTLSAWMQPQLDENALLLMPLIDKLAEYSSVIRPLFWQALEKLPPNESQEYHQRSLRFLPLSQHPPLDTLDKPMQLVLVRYYQQLHEPEVIPLLLQACQSQYREVALAASQDWHPDRVEQLTLEPILPLLRSRFAGVQERALGWIIQLSKHGKELRSQELVSICSCFSKIDNPAVSRPLCELIAAWVKQYKQAPTPVVETVGMTLEQLIQRNQFDGAPARPMIQALKAIAQSEDSSLNPENLYRWSKLLLMTISLIKVPHSEPEMIDLLSAIVRLQDEFLQRMVHEICPIMVEKKWWRNLSAILRTVRRVENSQSVLLDDTLRCEWCTPEVNSLILEIRGV